MSKVSSTIRKKQIRKDGKTNIKIRIFHKGKTRYIGTKYYVKPKDFSISDGKVKRSHPNSSFLNKELKLLEARYETKIIEIPNADYLTCSQIVEKLTLKEEIANFLEVISAKIVSLIPSDPDEKSTWEKYYYTRINIKKYLGYEDNFPKKFKRHHFKVGMIEEPFLPFYEIDQDFLIDFTDWHLSQGNSMNTAAVDLRNIRAVFNDAIDNKQISADLYPFRSFKIKTKKTRKRSIHVESMRKLFQSSDNEDLNEFEKRAVDVLKILFFLIGINMKDLFLLEAKDYDGDRITYDRRKTEKHYSIKVYEELNVLLEKYKDPTGERLLDFHNHYRRVHEFTKSTNKFIRKVIEKIELEENVTTYTMRHTWATLAYNHGISKDTVQKALGHGSETVTDVYIDFDLKAVDEANRKVMDLVL